MELDEALSRLVDGDLPPDEAHALRVRIAEEDGVARRYADLITLVAELEGLPEELPAPVVVPYPPLAWAGWALAAVAALWLLVPKAPSVIVQTPEAAVYDGNYSVHAGDLWIDVHGKVGVWMEPGAGAARVGTQEEPMKAITHMVAAAAGGLVTVVVYQGTANVRGVDRPTVELSGGDTQRFLPAVVAAPAPQVPSSTKTSERIEELEAELAKVEAALGQERFAKILTKGQLDAERGLPTEWPADLDLRLTPQQFPAEIAQVVASLPGVELVKTDCSEYPCIGVLKVAGDPGVDWQRPIGQRIGAWAKDALDGHVSLAMSAMADGEGDDQRRFVVFSAHGEERGTNVSQRTGSRMEDLELGLSDQP